MKANVLLPGALGLALLSACAPTAQPPAPAPPPVAAAQPPAPPLVRPLGDWRDAPLTAGAWRWSNATGRSTAHFALPGEAPLLSLTCAASGTVQLVHAGTPRAATPLAITTSGGIFPLMTDPVLPGASGITVTLPARAPVLDAMAYSRGRFVVEVAGLAPSYVPAWPEVARVVEDCR